jgi:hypothetical protein
MLTLISTSGWLDKAWEIQTKWEFRLKSSQKRRSEALKRKNEARNLPDLKDIAVVRNYLLYAMGVCLVPGVINVFTHWFDFQNSPCYNKFGYHYLFCVDPPKPWFAGLQLYFWGFFLMLWLWFMIFDYCIYKRGGKGLIFGSEEATEL